MSGLTGFSSPIPNNPSIAGPTPFEKLGPERQKEYAELLKTAASLETPLVEEKKKPDTDGKAEEAVPAVYEETEPAVEVSEEDKQNFLRYILGDKPFQKTYTFFADCNISLRDRTSQETEEMYRTIDADAKQGKISIDTEEQWEVYVERYKLAAMMQTLSMGGTAVNVPTKLSEKLDVIMKLPRPAYSVLMDLGRRFEDLVVALTEKAYDPTFWQTGGVASRS